jgi:hypothetical protein
MTQTFGVKVWPPPELLPGAIRDRLTAFGEARDRVAKAQAQLGNVRRVELPEAQRRDLEGAADAVEAGRPASKVSHEQKVAQKIAGLEHEIQVAELVETRCLARLNGAVEEHAAQISHEAERRMGEARKRFLSTVDELATAADAVREALALKVWAAQPSMNWKVRSVGVPIERHADAEPDIDSVLAALRVALEPRRRPPMPSPFGTVPAPEPQPEVEPAQASPDYAAELAAGSPPAA